MDVDRGIIEALPHLPGAFSGHLRKEEAGEDAYRSVARLMLFLARVLPRVPLVRRDRVTGILPRTLDRRDVRLARSLLKDRSVWDDIGTIGEYESAFAHWNGSAHAFSFAAGRVALSACIYALGLKPGDEVILPGYTCVVVANAFEYAGVKPVYADIELQTYGLDVAQAEKKITPRTRAILVQHLYGLVCRDYEATLEMARARGMKVIEDCCHSTGASFGGVRVGNRGDVAFYSSEHSKVMNTVQGGIAVTNDELYAGRLKEFQDNAPFPSEAWTEKLLLNVPLDYFAFMHPQGEALREFALELLGYWQIVSTTGEEMEGIKPASYARKMPAPAAALGILQLEKIDRLNEARRTAAKRWDRWCDDKGYGRPLVLPGSTPVFLRYPVLVEPEKKLDSVWLEEELGAEMGVWFVSNLHPSNRPVDGCPNADEAVRRCINLPCNTELT